MKEENEITDELNESVEETANAHSTYVVPKDKNTHLSGMYQTWFLDYASYVILERAVPHIGDGLKPVQRRILHSMKELDDGRFNKVANIVGNTMQYHPHGDASIGDALVQLGQKDLLIDCQGNWGNILTGDGAAAPRYIEARLSRFALETVFNAKTTEWTMSYDGRKKEPVTLPIKFPLLLAQGAEGIAVGLSSKILPHNFNELIDAAVAYLKGEEFALYPDFPTGGFIDVTRYNDGERGGSVRVRSKIDKIDNKTLEITDIPYGKTTETLIDSIIKAQEKGKIKIRKVEDNTAEFADIIVHLLPGTSSDKAIDALYAFTDCEISISPNCCVINDNKPHFLNVSDVLRHSVDTTKDLLRQELEIQKSEYLESLLFASLEKIFIEERIYKDKEYEQSKDEESAIKHIDKRLTPFKPNFVREITHDDIARLLEVKVKRIIKFNSEKADNNIMMLKDKINEIDKHLANLVGYTIDWFEHLKSEYGHEHPRRTIIRSFDNIEAATVAEANEKLYINREDGFIGTGLKKDEFVCNCSDIDDIIIFFKDGKYKVVKVSEKLYVGKNIIYINVFKRNDLRTIYNLVYQDGKGGTVYMKRFAVTGVTRDKEYDMTRGKKGSKIWWFSANPNGEAETLRITLKEKPRLKKLQFDIDFADLAIKGKAAIGNLVTRNEVHRVSLKEKGVSTLGGREVWFDPDVLRLNYDGRGNSLGEFFGDDLVLVILKDGQYYTSTFDASNHYEDNIMIIEKYKNNKVWTAVLNDADQGYPYIKRFAFEPTTKKLSFIGENAASELLLLSDNKYPRFQVTFGGADSVREPLIIDAEEYIGEKSYKAKGKRVTTFEVDNIKEIEPREVPEEELEEPEIIEETVEEEQINQNDVRDELTGQMRLFDNEELK
jgi:topoisomerase-4 subunit A